MEHIANFGFEEDEIRVAEAGTLTALPTLVAIRRIREATAILKSGRTALEAGQYGRGPEVSALIAAIAGRDFPMKKDTPEWQSAKMRLYKAGSPGPDGKPKFVIDEAVANKFKDDAMLALDLAIEALRSGELSAVALYRSAQPLSAAWDNLQAIELAQRITERATQYYRGRVFE